MSSRDRIAGALVGMAAGDALGAGYEFAAPPRGEVSMIGGGLGGFAPGEWTDDTSMAVCITQVTAAGTVDLAAIGERFIAWQRTGPADIGNATDSVLRNATSGAEVVSVAAEYFQQHPTRAAGNGALMRTAPIALVYLGDDVAIADAARAVAGLTHADPLAGDSCVLWCIAIDRAIRESRLDGVRDGLALLPGERRVFWAEAITDAEQRSPRTFTPNGFTVTALQAAHAAIMQTPIPDDSPARHLQDALVEAVRIGDDTDTVAAIAGMVLGARWGASAVPVAWRRILHGWPGLRAEDLVHLAVSTARAGQISPLASCGDERAEAVGDVEPAPPEPPATALHWDRILALRSRLATGASGSRVPPGRQADGAFTMRDVVRSRTAEEFVATLYEEQVVVAFDWPSWMEHRGRELAANRHALATASLEDCRCLLTALVRADRFDDGALLGALGSGLVDAILARIEEVATTE